MIRNMLHEALIVVRKLGWKAGPLSILVQVFSEFVMNPNSDSIPDGLRIHFTDIYLDELEKTGGEQVR